MLERARHWSESEDEPRGRMLGIDVVSVGAASRTGAFVVEQLPQACREFAVDGLAPSPPWNTEAHQQLLAGVQRASGTYEGRVGSWRVQLWIDTHPEQAVVRLSGDFYRAEAGQLAHLGWFFVRSSTVQLEQSRLIVRGIGRFTCRAEAPLVQVELPLDPMQSTAALTLQFITPRLCPGARYHCTLIEPGQESQPD